MGNYADWADVVGRYPKINSIGDSGEIQDSFIAGVEAVMNAHLAKQFAVPVSGKPGLLTDICIDFVYYRAMRHKEKTAGPIGDAAMQILKSLSDGEILLIDSNGDTVATNGPVSWSTTQNYHYTHSMLGADQDLIDPDWISDLVNERES